MANDPFFGLDASMIAGLSGATGEAIIIKKLVSFFPKDQNHEVAINATATNVQVLAQSALVGFASDSLRGHVKSVCDIMMSIKMKLAPAFEKNKCAPTVQKCIDLAGNFPRFCKTSKSDVLKGWAALEGRYQEVARMMASKSDKVREELSAELLSDLQVFWWAVPAEWNDTIEACRTFLSEANGAPVARGGAASSSSAEPAAKKAKGSSSSSSAAPSREVLLRSSVLGRF